MFYKVFTQLCDSDMQAKLGSVPNVEQMTFDQPLQNRRINAMDTKMIKGKSASDYFLAMKLVFDEADMGKETIQIVMLSLYIACLLAEGTFGKIKEALLDMLRDNPNPWVTDVPKFMAKIKQLESLENATEYTRNVKQMKLVLLVTQKVPEEKDEVIIRQEDRPHYLCGKVHKKGQRTFEYKGFGMKGSQISSTPEMPGKG